MADHATVTGRATKALRVNVESAHHFAGRFLLALGWIYHPGAELTRLQLLLNDTLRTKLHQVLVRFPRDDVTRALADEEPDHESGFALLVHLRHPPSELRLGGIRVATESASANALFEISEVTEFAQLFSTVVGYPPAPKCQIVKQLLIEASQPGLSRMPLPSASPDTLAQFLRAHVDVAMAVPGEGVYICGWLADPGNQVDSLYLQSNGRLLRKDLIPELSRNARPDVVESFKEHLTDDQQLGFSCFVRLPEVPTEHDGLRLIFVTAGGELIHIPVPLASPVPNTLLSVETVLEGFDPSSANGTECLDRVLGPTVEGLWSSRVRPTLRVETTTFGTPNDAPECSIIVPLFGRYDFIDYQLSQFAADREIGASELIYVVDDPRIYSAVIRHCGAIQPIFEVPFRVVASGFNLGFAGANNLGVAQSQAGTVLLLNSDVIPSAPGWLSRLLQFHRELDRAGAIAPRLLYEDGSIQHAGMSFGKNAILGGLWVNEHPGKGQPGWLQDVEQPLEAPAVTAACMMLRRDQYDEVAGFDDGYIIGDFEDSDLCLKLREAGYANYYIPGVELFHLERQSLPLFAAERRRFRLTAYNCWRHNRRWGSVIDTIMGATAHD